jgi:hypothetical protein
MSDETGKEEALGLLGLIVIGLVWWGYSTITAPDITLEIQDAQCSTAKHGSTVLLEPGTWSFPKDTEFEEDGSNCIVVDATYTDSSDGKIVLKSGQVLADAHFIRTADGVSLGRNTVKVPDALVGTSGQTGVVKICAKDDLIDDAEEDLTIQLSIRCNFDFLCQKACKNRWEVLKAHMDSQSDEADSSFGRLMGAIGGLAMQGSDLFGKSTEDCERNCRSGGQSRNHDKVRDLSLCLTKAKTYADIENCGK